MKQETFRISKMTNYDRINVPNMLGDKQNGFLCSICGQYTALKDSASYRGFNLVCMRDIWKISSILDIDMTETIHAIQNKGKISYETYLRHKKELGSLTGGML